MSLNTKKKLTTISRGTEGQKVQKEISTAVWESMKLQKRRKEFVILSPWYHYPNMQIKMQQELKLTHAHNFKKIY